ncbi:hypothetical protein AAF712_000935 [Marasmius tenuissimus]|uniref:Uncharacterized protein n=1 Tax=Marasmius tenuissimus TaxID=585030 RepID=A0ABR3AHE4_9AGAR
MRSFSILSLLVATLVSSAVATPGRTHISVHQHQRRANKLAKRISHSDDAVWNIEKRQAEGARMTYYKAGLGACGGYNGDNDKIVALNEYQWDGGKHCGQQITIEINGITAQATITDLCPFDSCPFGALDLTHGLFSIWGNPEQLGVMTGRWWFGSGGGGGGQQPTTTRHEEPTTTPPPPPPTTSTTSTPPRRHRRLALLRRPLRLRPRPRPQPPARPLQLHRPPVPRAALLLPLQSPRPPPHRFNKLSQPAVFMSSTTLLVMWDASCSQQCISRPERLFHILFTLFPGFG